MKTITVLLILSLSVVPALAQSQTIQQQAPTNPNKPPFDERAFYECAVVACSIAATMGFLFFGPAGFATACTAGMLSCAARTAGMLDINNPDEVRAFLEAFQGICERPINDTIMVPYRPANSGSLSPVLP